MDLQHQIDQLKKELELLKQKRIHQADITPQAVKTRHIGEGVPYVQSGLNANRPTTGALVTNGSAIYFATDTEELSIWNGLSWTVIT